MIPSLTRRNPIQYVQSLGPTAWWRYGVGITQAGGKASAWADQTANGNNLAQATAGAQPAVQANNTLLFDGVDDFMQATFTLSQPCTVYVAFIPVVITDVARIFDGVTANARLFEVSAGSLISMAAGASLAGTATIAQSAKGVACGVFNGASSVLHLAAAGVNDITTGNAGANNMGGITLGGSRAGVEFSNIAVYEMLAFAGAHDATTRLNVLRYLASVAGTGL